MPTSKFKIHSLSKWLVVSFTIFIDLSKLTTQAQCLPDIVGIWEEGQDVVSTLLTGKKVFKFENGKRRKC